MGRQWSPVTLSSFRQAAASCHTSKCGFQSPFETGSESESILEFSSVIFPGDFLSPKATHSHLSLLSGVMRNSQECWKVLACDAAPGLRAAVLWAKGKSAGVSETSFCGLQRERGRSGLVGGGEDDTITRKREDLALEFSDLKNNQMNEGGGSRD